jgi:hypothetical protein
MFTSLPNAATAADQVIQGKYAKAEAQAKKVEAAILDAIKQGERKAYFTELLEHGVKAQLSAMGYSIRYESDQRDGSYSEITW